jgi:hypothetical protein
MNEYRIALFREALALEEQKESIEWRIRQMDSRLREIWEVLSPRPVYQQSAVRARPQPGVIKGAILGHLKTAGASGLKVAELAQRIHAKRANVFSWFSMNAGKHPEIRKIGRAKYRWEPPTTSEPAN